MVADLNLLGSVGDLYCFCNTLSMLVLCNFHVCNWKNADIKDLNALRILINFLWIYLVEKGGGCTNACICIGTHSQPWLQNRLMDVYETW